jgi:hypothetical protein
MFSERKILTLDFVSAFHVITIMKVVDIERFVR